MPLYKTCSTLQNSFLYILSKFTLTTITQQKDTYTNIGLLFSITFSLFVPLFNNTQHDPVLHFLLSRPNLSLCQFKILLHGTQHYIVTRKSAFVLIYPYYFSYSRKNELFKIFYFYYLDWVCLLKGMMLVWPWQYSKSWPLIHPKVNLFNYSNQTYNDSQTRLSDRLQPE